MALERETIVAAALDLLDETGLEGLTMRRLAEALQVQAPSLYWHFPDKPTLLDEMAAALIGDIAREIDAAAGHKTVLRQTAFAVRRALLSRRDGARMFAGTFVVRHNVLRLAEITLGALLRAGFSPQAATRTNFSLFYYVLGFVIEEQAQARQQAHREQLIAATDQCYPCVRQTLAEILDDDQDSRFAFGVELILKGIDAD